MKNIEIEGDKIHLKKKGGVWRIVYPRKNPDGSINWKNLIAGGNWFNLIKIGVLVIMLSLAVSEYLSIFNTARECLELNELYHIIR